MGLTDKQKAVLNLSKANISTKLNYRQKYILKKVVEIEEATDYRNRCLNVLVCPRCGCRLVPNYGGVAESLFKCDNDKCSFATFIS